MGIGGAGASGDQTHPHELGEDAVGLLAPLQDKKALTVVELREREIEAPSQANTLELTGYQVDRTPVRQKQGRQRMGYRPCAGSPPADHGVDALAGGISR